MFDERISLPRIMTLHPELRNEAISIFNEIEESGVIPRCTFAYRSWPDQDLIYSYGRTRPNPNTSNPNAIATNAKAGFSFHNYGLAIDCCLLRKGDMFSLTADDDKDGIADWLEMVKIFEAHGWEAGYRWKMQDSPHFQKSSFKIEECLRRYITKELDVFGYISLE